jgi:hypothetical protein
VRSRIQPSRAPRTSPQIIHRERLHQPAHPISRQHRCLRIQIHRVEEHIPPLDWHAQHPLLRVQRNRGEIRSDALGTCRQTRASARLLSSSAKTHKWSHCVSNRERRGRRRESWNAHASQCCHLPSPSCVDMTAALTQLLMDSVARHDQRRAN